MYNLFSSRKEIHQIPFLFNPKSQIKHTSQPPLQLGGFWPVECGPKKCIQCPSLATRNYWATLCSQSPGKMQMKGEECQAYKESPLDGRRLGAGIKR